MFAAFMILFGVMVFSYIMGEYIELLEGYKEHHKEFDEGDGLRMFLGVLKHFNSNEEMDYDFKLQIEEFFAYRWGNDKNQAFQEDMEQDLLEQLPKEVQNDIF
jgi:hypothetical protein